MLAHDIYTTFTPTYKAKCSTMILIIIIFFMLIDMVLNKRPTSKLYPDPIKSARTYTDGHSKPNLMKHSISIFHLVVFIGFLW